MMLIICEDVVTFEKIKISGEKWGSVENFMYL